VRTAYSGEAALAAAEAFKPQIVFLDIGLPGLDGFQVAERLRRSPATAPSLLVAMTGYGQKQDLDRAKAAGFDRHLVKPVELGAMQAAIATAGKAEG
jgi:CheY-like chemotaxis protein